MGKRYTDLQILGKLNSTGEQRHALLVTRQKIIDHYFLALRDEDSEEWRGLAAAKNIMDADVLVLDRRYSRLLNLYLRRSDAARAQAVMI